MNVHTKSLIVISIMMTTPTACVLLFTDLIDKVNEEQIARIKPEEFSSKLILNCEHSRQQRELVAHALAQAPNNPTLNVKYGEALIEENFECSPVPEMWKI